MSDDTIELRVGKVEYIMEQTLISLQKLDQTSAEILKQMSDINRKVDHLEYRLKDIEQKAIAADDYIRDATNLKAQLTGARKLIIYQWTALGFIVMSAVFLYDHFIK